MNDGLKMSIISPPQVNLINLNRCAHVKGGIPILHLCHMLALLSFSPPHTMNQPSSGPWKEFTWLHVHLPKASGLPHGELLLFLVFLLFDQDIRMFTLRKIKITPPSPNRSLKLRSQTLSPM